MKMNLDSLKELANKALALGAHANLAIDVIRATLGHALPDDANRLAKLVSETGMGGKNSWVDEARMVEAKIASIPGLDGNITTSELKMIRGLEECISLEYGDGFFGNMFRDRYGNKLRPGLLHLTTSKRDVVDRIARVVGNKTVHDEIVRSIPGDNSLLKKYLKYLVREMRSSARTAVGTNEEKALVGYRRALILLRDDGFPALQFAELAQMADAALEAAPDAAKALAELVREKAPEFAEAKANVAKYTKTARKQLRKRNKQIIAERPRGLGWLWAMLGG